MSNSKVDKTKEFLLKYFELLNNDGSSGKYITFPEYDLYARDYLRFAEKELEENTPSSLINCVSHLKRAMDCQLDTFLYTFNLLDTFNKRSLKVEKKLDFLKSSGVFSSRSLARLNIIRNKMEHEYEIPKVKDIEAYYDLVTAFVAVLEYTSLSLNLNCIMDFYISEEYGPQGRLSIGYDHDKLLIYAKWEVEENSNVDDGNIEVTIKEYDDFASMFRIILLLNRSEGTASIEYLISQLKAI